jgi:uncharacterized protein involved in exopolysaccharide biosynthesis
MNSAADGSSLLRTVNSDEEIKTVAETLKRRGTIERTIDKLQLTREALRNIRDFRRYVQMTIDGVIDGLHWAYEELKYTFHLAARPTPQELAFVAREDLIADVAWRVAVTAVPSTNVLTAAFRAGDPYLAQNVINSLVTDFIEPRAAQNSSDFFAGEQTKAAQDLQAAEGKLAEYRQQTSIFAIETQRKLLLEATEHLRGELTKVETQQAEKQAAYDALKVWVRTEPRFQREITKSLIDTQVELSGYAAAIAVMRDGINARTAELTKLTDAEVRGKDLELLVARTEAAYNLQQRNFEQAWATERMAAAQLADVQLVDLAWFPLSPVRPRTWLYLSVVLGAAVLAAIAAPFIAHMSDTTLGSELDVMRLLNIPFVATVPTDRASRRTVSYGGGR